MGRANGGAFSGGRASRGERLAGDRPCVVLRLRQQLISLARALEMAAAGGATAALPPSRSTGQGRDVIRVWVERARGDRPGVESVRIGSVRSACMCCSRSCLALSPSRPRSFSGQAGSSGVGECAGGCPLARGCSAGSGRVVVVVVGLGMCSAGGPRLGRCFVRRVGLVPVASSNEDESIWRLRRPRRKDG